MPAGTLKRVGAMRIRAGPKFPDEAQARHNKNCSGCLVGGVLVFAICFLGFGVLLLIFLSRKPDPANWISVIACCMTCMVTPQDPAAYGNPAHCHPRQLLDKCKSTFLMQDSIQ